MSSRDQDFWVVTLCSRDKDSAQGLLPARARYLSPRVVNSAAAADLLGAGFRILSGKYGLLAGTTPIPDYDHLLTEEMVADHVVRIGEQLSGGWPRRVVFVVRSLEADPGAQPYRKAMALACTRKGIAFSTVVWRDPPPTAESLALMIKVEVDRAGSVRDH